jgi:hypothetical protein
MGKVKGMVTGTLTTAARLAVLLLLAVPMAGCILRSAEIQFNDSVDITLGGPTLKSAETPICQSGSAPATPQSALPRLSTPELRKIHLLLVEGMVTDPTTAQQILADPGITAIPGSIPSEQAGVFSRQMTSNVPGSNTLSQLTQIAQVLAGKLSSNSSWFQAFAGCAATQPTDQTCMRSFVERLTSVAFTHRLSAERVGSVAQSFINQASQTQGNQWLRSALTYVLTSPESLYRVETGVTSAAQGWVDLSDEELAKRLASLFWDAPWDAWLRNRARTGQIRGSHYETVLNYIFSSPRFTSASDSMTRNFAFNWLRLKEAKPLTFNSPILRDRLSRLQLPNVQSNFVEINNYTELAIQEALDYFAEHFKMNSSFEQMFLGRESYARGSLAIAQGMQPWSGSGQPALHPPQTKAGPMSLSALHLSVGPSKNHLHLGYNTLKIFLCGSVPPPESANISSEALILPNATDLVSTRIQQHLKTQPRNCVGCHKSFNFLGFMQGKMDHMGAFRNVEQIYNTAASSVTHLGELPIDDEVTFQYGNRQVTVAGPTEAAQFLLETGLVQQCFARHWFTHLLGRAPSRGGEDGCAIQSMVSKLSEPETPMVEALKALARTAVFTKTFRGTP